MLDERYGAGIVPRLREGQGMGRMSSMDRKWHGFITYVDECDGAGVVGRLRNGRGIGRMSSMDRKFARQT